MWPDVEAHRLQHDQSGVKEPASPSMAVTPHACAPAGAALRVHGPWTPQAGHRFDAKRALLDPFAVAIIWTADWDFGKLAGNADPTRPSESQAVPGAIAKSLLANHRFDWEADRYPRHPWSRTIIYETHVRGFTIHPSANAASPGTLSWRRGEDSVSPGTRRDCAGIDAAAGVQRAMQFAAKSGNRCAVVQLLGIRHRSLLDVVFNHTAEGNENGPKLSFRGLDNSIYYMLQNDKRYYKNYAGCGNTLNCNHPVVRDFVIDCLRYWVAEMHVDGFRFDLATVLGRGENGELLHNPPLLERIAEDPILRDAKLIAEAWDAGGAYQVGNFSGRRWTGTEIFHCRRSRPLS